MQSMKEKWLGFAIDENVVRALKDIRRVAAKHGIRHVSVQILDGMDIPMMQQQVRTIWRSELPD